MNTEVWRNATPEQKIIWNYCKSLIAFNHITKIFYEGGLAVDFTVNNPGKLYLALYLQLDCSDLGTENTHYLTLRNKLNVIIGEYQNLNSYWDVTTSSLKFCHNSIKLSNIYFSSMDVDVITGRMIFNGYRLEII